MTKDVQELDKIVEDERLLPTSLRRTHEDIVATEASGFVDVLEGGIWSTLARENKGCRAPSHSLFPLVSTLPFVYVVPLKKCETTCKTVEEDSRNVCARSMIRDREWFCILSRSIGRLER